MTFRFPPRSAAAKLLPIAALALAFSALASAQVSLRVVHGIPGRDIAPTVDPDLPVDILVNDAVCLASGFPFGESIGPFSLPGGTYNVKVSLANTLEPCSGDAVIDADVPLNDGENATIVAHLTETGMPTAGKFLNDTSAPDEGLARVTAHHLAAAPAVDIVVNPNVLGGNPLTIPGAANGAQASADITGVATNIGIVPAGGRSSLFVRSLLLKPGPTYNVYAVGSLENGTFTLLIDQIGGAKGFVVRF